MQQDQDVSVVSSQEHGPSFRPGLQELCHCFLRAADAPMVQKVYRSSESDQEDAQPHVPPCSQESHGFLDTSNPFDYRSELGLEGFQGSIEPHTKGHET